MRIFFLFLILMLAPRAWATDIDIGAATLPGLNRNDIGNDTSMSGISVMNGLTAVTCSSCVPNSAVGMGGFKVALNGVTYDVASVASRSAFTLATSYTGITGTVTGTWYKFVVFRIYVTAPFVPSGSTVTIPAGSVGSQNWFRRYGASVINDGTQNVLYIPAVDNLPATTNSSNPNAKYAGQFYTTGNTSIDDYPGCIAQWQLNHLITPTSWSQICSYNIPNPPPPTIQTSYVTQVQLDAIHPSCVANNGVYYSATGNVQSCLTFGTGLLLSGGTLSTTIGATAYTTVQEEGSSLTQRSTLNFVGSSYTAADSGGKTNLTSDSDLDALASNSTNGLWARTGAGTGAARTVISTSTALPVTNGDGISGNPSLALDADLDAIAALASTGYLVRTATNTWAHREFSASTISVTVANGTGAAGNTTIGLDSDLEALGQNASNGLWARTGTGTGAARTITGTSNQVIVTNGDGVSGNPTLATPQDIAASSSPTFAGLTLGVGGAGNLLFGNGSAIRTGTGSGNTFLLQAYDTDTGPAYVTQMTLAAGTTPTITLNQPLFSTDGTGRIDLNPGAGFSAARMYLFPSGQPSQLGTFQLGQSNLSFGGTARDMFVALTPDTPGSYAQFGGFSAAGTILHNQNNTNPLFFAVNNVLLASMNSGGLWQTRAGNGSTPSTDSIALDGTYHTAVPASTPGSGTVTTSVKTVSANVLGRDGDWLEVWIFGRLAGTTNSKEIQFSVNQGGANVVVSTAAFTNANTYSSNDWFLHAFIRRDTSTNIEVEGWFQKSSGSGTYHVIGPADFFSSGWNFASTFTLDIITINAVASEVNIDRVLVVKHSAP